MSLLIRVILADTMAKISDDAGAFILRSLVSQRKSAMAASVAGGRRASR